jgi:hypothetical protein
LRGASGAGVCRAIARPRLVDKYEVAASGHSLGRHGPVSVGVSNDLSTRALRGSVVRAQIEANGTPPARALLEFWDRLGDWAEKEGHLGCPYLKALAEIEEPDHVARLEVDAFVQEVDDYFTETAEAAGFPHPRELGIRLRLLTMGVLTAIVVERSRLAMERARDITISLLASIQGLTRSEMEAVIADA